MWATGADLGWGEQPEPLILLLQALTVIEGHPPTQKKKDSVPGMATQEVCCLSMRCFSLAQHSLCHNRLRCPRQLLKKQSNNLRDFGDKVGLEDKGKGSEVLPFFMQPNRPVLYILWEQLSSGIYYLP